MSQDESRLHAAIYGLPEKSRLQRRLEDLIFYAVMGAVVAAGYFWEQARPKTLAHYESDIMLAYRRYGDIERVDRLAQEISRILSEAYRNGHPLTKDRLIHLYLGTTMEEMCRGIFEVWRNDPARAAEWLALADGAAGERQYCQQQFERWYDVDRPFAEAVLDRVYDWRRP